jgi:hypothetical protein
MSWRGRRAFLAATFLLSPAALLSAAFFPSFVVNPLVLPASPGHPLPLGVLGLDSRIRMLPEQRGQREASQAAQHLASRSGTPCSSQ